MLLGLSFLRITIILLAYTLYNNMSWITQNVLAIDGPAEYWSQ